MGLRSTQPWKTHFTHPHVPRCSFTGPTPQSDTAGQLRGNSRIRDYDFLCVGVKTEFWGGLKVQEGWCPDPSATGIPRSQGKASLLSARSPCGEGLGPEATTCGTDSPRQGKETAGKESASDTDTKHGRGSQGRPPE